MLDFDLFDRVGRASQAPAIMELGLDGTRELNERVVAAETWEALTPADRALIELAERQISAGLSPTLQHPDNWAGSDWAAEDAALGLVPAEAPDDTAAVDPKSLPEVADGDWIGM